MIRFLLIAGSLLLFIAPKASRAQDNKRFVLTGIIKDSSQGTVPFATIRQLNNQQLPVQTTTAGEDGRFVIDSMLPAGFLLVSAGGYAEKTVSMAELKTGVLNVIYLQRNTLLMKGVTVSATGPLVKREADKLVYNMEADPESKFRTVLDIMKKVPFLSVDAQGNLFLKGNSGYRILVNGKPSGLMDNNAREFLKNMPASTIQNIEVYTTPPSKYDAEGLAGVINIITTKKIGEGYKGAVNISESLPTGGPGGGFSFMATQKKFGVELFGGANGTHNPTVSTATSRVTTSNAPTSLTVSGTNKNNNNGRYMGTQFSYEIDSLQLITAQLNANGFYANGTISRFSVLKHTEGLLQQFRQQNASRNKNRGFDGALNYQLGFKKDKSKLLTASYRFMQYRTASRSENAFTDQVQYQVADFNQFNKTSILEQTGQADYIQTLKKLKLEAGIKAIFRQNKSDFHTLQYDAANDTFVDDPAQQNLFTNNQAVLSAYNTYMLALKQWNFKAGIRMEQTINRVNFQSTNTQVNNTYFNLVPSIVINRNNTGGSYFSLGYNQRLKRPGINRLNPFVNRSNPNFEETGNPGLKATRLHNFDLGYGFNRKQSVNIGLNYAFAHNFDLRSSRYDPATRITYITYSNSGDITALVLNMNLNLAVTKAWRAVINGNLAHFWIQSEADAAAQKLTRFIYSASLNNTYTFNKQWTAGASADFIGRNIAPAQVQGTINGFIATSFSLSKGLLNNKLALSAYINNPFTRFRNNRTEISGLNFIQTDVTAEYFRKAGVSVNYKFGKLKQEIKRNKRGINNSDVAN